VTRRLLDFLPNLSGLGKADGTDELLGNLRRPSLFLDRFSLGDIQSAVRRWGIHSALVGRGIDYQVAMDTSNPQRHELRFSLPDGQLLGELGLGVLDYDLGKLCPWSRGGKARLLVVQWIRLQDPRRRFGGGVLPLPGQEHPGLGVGQQVMGLIHAVAVDLHLDGVINRPEFLHNAFLYLPHFRFALPDIQGRLDALLRDVMPIPVVELAWAMESGALRDEAGDTAFQWFRSEQVLPVSARLKRFFAGMRYKALRTASRKRASFSVDLAGLERTMEDLRRRFG
jgi:hypothetical protein